MWCARGENGDRGVGKEEEIGRDDDERSGGGRSRRRRWQHRSRGGQLRGLRRFLGTGQRRSEGRREIVLRISGIVR